MKKLFHLALATLVVSIVACQKQTAGPSPTVDSKATARQIFEQQKSLLPQTKLSNAQDLVKPLPGDFTPLWDQAVELTTAGQTSVTVPITSSVSYNAVYPCENLDADHHHNHHPISVIQKLVIITSADNPKCYIANTVPYEDGDGEFTGFTAYHNFDGTLSHIDQFDNGAKVVTAQSGDDELIGEITRAVKLYPNNSTRITNYLPQVECFICHDASCNRVNVVNAHCANCFKLYSKCQCLVNDRCQYCRKPKAGPDNIVCKCSTSGGDGGGGTGTPCSLCGSTDCQGHISMPPCALCKEPYGYCSQYNDGRYLEEYVHVQTLLDVFGDIVSQSNRHYLQLGSRVIDREQNSEGDEFKHNLRLPYEDYNAAYNKLRNWFILKIQQHKTSYDLSRFGEALHPILDSYISTSERMEMLSYFTYATYGDIVSSMSPSSNKNSAAMSIYNAVQSLPQYPTDAQAGAVFDDWANFRDR